MTLKNKIILLYELILCNIVGHIALILGITVIFPFFALYAFVFVRIRRIVKRKILKKSSYNKNKRRSFTTRSKKRKDYAFVIESHL